MKVWKSKDHKNEVAIVSGVRTPFAKAGTDLKTCSAVHLGVTAAREALARGGVSPADLDEVVFGNAGTPADAANISRVIGLRTGTPKSVPAYTVHRNCASAMEAIGQGALKIGAGLADTMLVGGTESMSSMPLIYGEEMTELFAILTYAKSPQKKVQSLLSFKPKWLKPVVAIMEGLTDPISGMNMGQTAEVLAREFHISREEQDKYAVKSHAKTVAAQKEGRFADEIFPVVIEPKFKNHLELDVGPRDGQSLEKLAALKPFFDKRNGTVTPGNACPITDGAAALVMMNAEKAKSEGREILAKLSAFTFTGCDPARMGMGPTHSTAQLLNETGLSLKEIDLIELNEAFAAQVIANQKAFESKKYASDCLGQSEVLGELREDILNVNGGAIALGHPVGATGARLVLTLILEMKRRNVQRGLATLCIGGGQGAAFLLERN